MIDPEVGGACGLAADPWGVWLDLAAVERERGERSLLTLRLDHLLEAGDLCPGGRGEYFWTDGVDEFRLRVRWVGPLRAVFNRLRGRSGIEDYRVERTRFVKFSRLAELSRGG